MLLTSATPPTHRRPYIRRDGVWQDVYTSEEDQPNGPARFLTQGAAIGVLLGFLYPLIAILSNPRNGYNFLGLILLPIFIAGGMLVGAVEGSIIWACTYIAGHRLNALVRAGLGIVVLALALSVLLFVFYEPSPYREGLSTTHYLVIIGVEIGFGLLFGLVIGSRFHPWHELIRGTTSSQHPVLSAITGLALRVVVIFFLMESVLYVIWAQGGDFPGDDFTIGVITLTHFICATAIVFARMRFSGLLTAALIVNFPVALLIGGVLLEGHGVVRFVALSYFALWAAFVSSRFNASEKGARS